MSIIGWIVLGLISGFIASKIVNKSGEGLALAKTIYGNALEKKDALCAPYAAVIDITSMLGALVHWAHAGGNIAGPRPSVFHDSPFYDAYECSDKNFITLAPLEPKFYSLMLNKLGLTDVDAAQQYDSSHWPALKARLSALFRSRTRDEWCELIEGSDLCFAPVLSIEEAALHPHNLARAIFSMSSTGAIQASAAPRFGALVDGPYAESGQSESG